MFAKYMTSALIGSALVATAAFAQSPSEAPKTDTPAATAPSTNPATSPPADSTNMSTDKTSADASATVSTTGQWRASKVVGLSIYNDKNESLGSVNELLMDKDGKIHAAVLSVGGFLGVGAHYVAVPYDQIKWVNEPVPSTGTSASGGNKMSTGTTTGAAPAAAPATASKPNPWYPDHGVFNATKEQLKSMPEFKYST